MSISYIPDQQDYKEITPFKRFVLQSFPWIDETFDALTNYELMGKIIEYLNTIISNENTVQSNVQELYDSFVLLHNYVSNYFDNLDVQDEINNKLDAMAENGTLAEIIEDYATIPELTSRISTAENDIDRLESDVDNLQLGLINDEIIIVGDSYLAGQSLTNPSTENFGYLLMQKLGMNTNNFHIWAEGGSSFTNPRKSKSQLASNSTK